MKDQIISTIIQCGVLIGIPFLLYMILNREKQGFLIWVGLFRPKNKTWLKYEALILIIAILIMAGPIWIFINLGIISEDILYSLSFREKGFSLELLLIILIKGAVQTALSEEVFFRGFIGKRIAMRYGYLIGNLIQSILFGLPHGLPFILVYKSYLFGNILFLSASIVGFMQFYINEKKADGSILPSLIIHSTMNIISNI